MNTIRENLYNGCTARIIGHTEVWIRQPAGHPMDPTRYPGYNQQNTADIADHCKRLKKIGLDVLMFNTYSVGSWENKSLEMYLPETVNAKLNVIINIDKGIYHKASPITEIRNYILYLRKVAFPLANYEKFNGKFIVTYFAMPGDDPKMFAQIEKENTDCIFIYNSPNFGHSQMSWVQQTLEVGLDQWCTKYATLNDGGLYIPHISPGFNDTFQGHSVWDKNKPPRVYPTVVGPNPTTLKNHFDVINKHYNATANPLKYIQLVTVNDWDELTSIESKADGTGGYFAPVPPTVIRGELWLDGNKICDTTAGNHVITEVKVMSDDTLVKSDITLVV